jgi:hypothetical protein
MGPLCSSAETQVCHRNYIIAAKVQPETHSKNSNFSSCLQNICYLKLSPRFLCRPTAFCSTCWSCGTSERSPQGKQRICHSNSVSTHFHVSWLSDFIYYPKPLYKSLHQSFFYSFITILPSECGVTLEYSTIFT